MSGKQWFGVLIVVGIFAATQAVIYYYDRSRPVANALAEDEVMVINDNHGYSDSIFHSRRKARTDSLHRVWLRQDSIYYDSVKAVYKARKQAMKDQIFAEIDSIRMRGHEKRDTIIELNTADTFSLQYIRGIGRYSAQQIVRYRMQLGGYYRVEQLLEIEDSLLHLDTLLCYFTADSTLITPIAVNTASLKRLSRHPYLSYEQAEAIYQLRRKYITLRSVEQLCELHCMTSEDINRLSPYLNFD